MKNLKNKIIIIIVVVIIIGLIGIVFYNQINKKENSNLSNKENIENKISINEELKDIISFAKKGTQLVAINHDGIEILLYDFKFFDVDDIRYTMQYTYNSGFYYYFDKDNYKIYLFLNTEGKMFIGFIDLTEGNGIYNLNILSTVENINNFYYNDVNYITKIDNYLYFGCKRMYKYDLNTFEFVDLNIESSKRIMQVLSYKNNIIYNINNDIYLLDTITNSSTKLFDYSSIAYIYNDLLIYRNDLNYSYYSYNFNTLENLKISNPIGVSTVDVDYIVPFDDGFYSFDMFDGNKLYKYNDNSLTLVNSFPCSDDDSDLNCKLSYNMINRITKIANSKILIDFSAEYGDYNGDSVIYDLITKEIKIVNNKSNIQYASVFYIK